MLEGVICNLAKKNGTKAKVKEKEKIVRDRNMLMSSKLTWIIGAGVFSLSSCTILDCAATAAWRRIEETTAIKDER